jgi:hypothetical protein
MTVICWNTILQTLIAQCSKREWLKEEKRSCGWEFLRKDQVLE